ncbi:hypothetical protein PILCRDRAFT_11331 [Piloderma croceum F 1598]|uniref:Uncharacterized protein n=1 Tax=Piloderma croceum (strain F 1598) TaxID=765440 RepID=A0A0C3F0N7_PILCF|nr:hypothetical protein PILCRDRAFT_11331 [Piloderma croceum F 1598]
MKVSSPPPGTLQGSVNDEMIMITNYRSHIEEAIRLLTSWVHELRPGKGSGSMTYPVPNRPTGYMGGFEMPITDSILPPGVMPAMFAFMADSGLNYRIDRIPQTMPPMLAQLKLEVAFMDKVMQESDLPRNNWDVEPGEMHFIDQMKDIFRACLTDDVVTIG